MSHYVHIVMGDENDEILVFSLKYLHDHISNWEYFCKQIGLCLDNRIENSLGEPIELKIRIETIKVPISILQEHGILKCSTHKKN